MYHIVCTYYLQQKSALTCSYALTASVCTSLKKKKIHLPTGHTPHPIDTFDHLGDGGRSNVLQPLTYLPPRDREDLVPFPNPTHSLREDFGNGGDTRDLLGLLHSEDELDHTHVVAVESQSAQLLLALLFPEHLNRQREREREREMIIQWVVEG